MSHSPINLAEKLALLNEHRSPKIVGRMNDYELTFELGAKLDHAALKQRLEV
jgi:hypothetical protein